METSGHQSVSGVRAYERTTVVQKKQVSEMLSSCRIPLQEVNTIGQKETLEPEEKQKENLGKFSIHNVEGYTYNFTFSS